MGRAAHPGAGPGRAAHRRMPHGLRKRPSLLLGGRAGASGARRTGNARRRQRAALDAARRLALEETDDAGNPAAEHEAGGGGADHRGLPVLAELLLPVGQLAHLRLEITERVLELAARLAHVLTDLLRVARHQGFASSRTALVAFASSIAISGAGGVPFLIRRLPKS